MKRRERTIGPEVPRAEWKAVLTGLFTLLGAAPLCCTTAVDGAALNEPPYAKTNLISFLAGWKPPSDSDWIVYELEPPWVGTVKRTYLRGGEGIYKEDKPSNIRFSHLMVMTDQDRKVRLAIVRGRITAQGKFGSYFGTEAPVFMSNLPSARVVSEAKNLDDLRKMFGAQHGVTDGWGGPRGLHWSEGWTWFTAEGKDRLRYLGVFAHVSSPDRHTPPEIDILHVTEGLFRPADPLSVAERMQFKTGEEVQADYEAGRAKDRVKYPLPLRSLVEAKATPDDSDLSTYKQALNEVRRNPSPELFRQFAEWIHEGRREIQIMLETLLFGNVLKLEQWEEPQRKIALRALADALPHVKTNLDLDQLVAFLLQALGGGELKLAVGGTNARIDVKAQRFPDGSGASYSTGSQNVSVANLSVAAEQCRKSLKQQYPELR
jgi:hypothetical protein